MAQFTINGGTPLNGSVRLGGAKNASYKEMVAALFAKGESRLLNLPHIEDVKIATEMIKSLGGGVRSAGERTLFVSGEQLSTPELPDEFGPASRASTLFIPVLLERFGRASVPLPGGDKIGARPLDRHFEGLKAMGAGIYYANNRIQVTAKKLQATTYRFAKNTHTGTETLLLSAVMADGVTILENAALEPEVDDLIELLVGMGARIRRRPGRVIEIAGVNSLHPTIHRVMPDRNEAVSYACAAIVTKGDIVVENAIPDHLESFLDTIVAMGAGYEIGNYGIRFYYKGALKSTDVTTRPHPGFMTDWQPLITVVLTQAEGNSIIHETIHSERFQHCQGLKKFGATIDPISIPVDDLDKTYNFDLSESNQHSSHAVVVKGPRLLKATEIDVYDLRSGATFVLAALAAKGQTVIHKVDLIDRGYEAFDERLRSLGATITRTN